MSGVFENQGIITKFIVERGVEVISGSRSRLEAVSRVSGLWDKCILWNFLVLWLSTFLSCSSCFWQVLSISLSSLSFATIFSRILLVSNLFSARMVDILLSCSSLRLALLFLECSIMLLCFICFSRKAFSCNLSMMCLFSMLFSKMMSCLLNFYSVIILLAFPILLWFYFLLDSFLIFLRVSSLRDFYFKCCSWAKVVSLYYLCMVRRRVSLSSKKSETGCCACYYFWVSRLILFFMMEILLSIFFRSLSAR